jgi:DNA-binding MarR family transcriptional regulator
MCEKRRSVVTALDSHLGYWLRLVSNHVSDAFAQALQERRVSVAEWVALRRIYDRSEISASEIAELIGMTRGAVSKVLDKLEEKRLIARTVWPEDNRVQWVTLTDTGAALLPELAAIADANDKQYFACLDSNEQSQLTRLMQKIAAANAWSDVPIS